MQISDCKYCGAKPVKLILRYTGCEEIAYVCINPTCREAHQSKKELEIVNNAIEKWNNEQSN